LIPNDFGFLWLAHHDTAVAGAEGMPVRCRPTMNPDRGPNARGLTPAPPLLAVPSLPHRLVHENGHSA
jgi:hypothetical protein